MTPPPPPPPRPVLRWPPASSCSPAARRATVGRLVPARRRAPRRHGPRPARGRAAGRRTRRHRAAQGARAPCGRGLGPAGGGQPGCRAGLRRPAPAFERTSSRPAAGDDVVSSPYGRTSSACRRLRWPVHRPGAWRSSRSWSPTIRRPPGRLAKRSRPDASWRSARSAGPRPSCAISRTASARPRPS